MCGSSICRKLRLPSSAENAPWSKPHPNFLQNILTPSSIFLTLGISSLFYAPLFFQTSIFQSMFWAPLKAIPVHNKVWKLLSWFIRSPPSSSHSPPGLDFTDHRCNVLNSFHSFACSSHLPSQSFTLGESFFQCCVLLSVVGLQLEKTI